MDDNYNFGYKESGVLVYKIQKLEKLKIMLTIYQ